MNGPWMNPTLRPEIQEYLAIDVRERLYACWDRIWIPTPSTKEAFLALQEFGADKFEIVVPLFSELMAQGAGDAIKGIYGTANWDWKLEDAATSAFTAARNPASSSGSSTLPSEAM